jgi:hypothetical protein
MPHFGFRCEIEQLLVDFLARQRRNRKGRHKMATRLSQDRADLCATLTQAPDKLEALVSRDAAADDEKYALTAEVQAPLLIKSDPIVDYIPNYDTKV